MIEYKVLKANRAGALQTLVREAIAEGFVPTGSHHVITTNVIYQYRGNQLGGQLIDREYSQTMIKL
jgi:hypothetical protein